MVCLFTNSQTLIQATGLVARTLKLWSLYRRWSERCSRRRFSWSRRSFPIFGHWYWHRLRDFRQEDIATLVFLALIIMRSVSTLTVKQQVEGLPEYNDRMTVDYDYEEQVGVYRPKFLPQASTATYDRDTYTTRSLCIDEGRLIKPSKIYAQRTVERTLSSVRDSTNPKTNQRVLLWRTDAGRAVSPGEIDFQEGEREKCIENRKPFKQKEESPEARKVVDMTRLKPKKLFVEKS